MMTFLMILAAIICLLTGFIAGLFVFAFVKEKEEINTRKGWANRSNITELKNFLNYDGISQE